MSAATDSPYYFRIVADYIHLNPARAGLAGGRYGKLTSHKWSSLLDYARGKGSDWLVTDRLLDAFELAKDGRGRRAYVADFAAVLLRERTTVGNGWLAKRLEMGHPGAVSRLTGQFRRDAKRMKELGKLKRMLKCDT